MNEKQVAFIICTNNMQYYNECVRYIGDLEVPEGYDTDIICVQEAESMAQGYNAGMQASEAKYKVYLHHDTFIINTHFIYDILNIFSKDERIGMIGVLGGQELPADANCYLRWDTGAVLVYNTKKPFRIENEQSPLKEYMPVETVDGLIMITQTDIMWREDLLDGWDFYDVVHSLEMKENGYRVVVPYQKEPWCYHDCGGSKLEKYDHYRHKVIKAYPQYFREDGNLEDKQQYEEMTGIRRGLQQLFGAGKYDELGQFTNDIKDLNVPDIWIQEAINIMDIYWMEKKSGSGSVSEWWGLRDWERIYEYYRWVRFVLLRAGYRKQDERIGELGSLIREGRITKDAVRHISYLTLELKEREDIYESFLKEDYEEPLVSVVIPVYNGAGFVSETVESVLSQTYQNMEIIIIDDASTDHSREIITSYHDKRIKTIFLDKNRNICYAGNQGFQAAKGKYVALIGHDDIWVNTKLEKQVAFMEEHPAYSVCFTWADIIDEEGTVSNGEYRYLEECFRAGNEPEDRRIRKLFFDGNTFCAPSACIRKEYLEQAGYYRYGLVQLQDYDLWLRLLCYGPVYIMCEKLTLYRRFRNSEQNLSTVNPVTVARSRNEFHYITHTFLDWISKEQFVWIFGQKMRNKDARSEKEIQCEKAFLLYDAESIYFIERFMKLLEEEEVRELLSEKYHFGLQDFYKMSGTYSVRELFGDRQ